MSRDVRESWARRISLSFALDVLERAMLTVLFGFFALKMLIAFRETGNYVHLLLFLSEGAVVVFSLIRRTAAAVSLRFRDWLIAFAGTVVPLLVQPETGTSPVPAVACSVFMIAGMVLQIAAKLTLRRSFGVVAANRGVKVRGPYRIVRHPMYAGYVLTQIGFLLANPSLWNVAVYMLAFALQVVRLLAEERLLNEDEAYRDFALVVPYRLLPKVF